MKESPPSQPNEQWIWILTSHESINRPIGSQSYFHISIMRSFTFFVNMHFPTLTCAFLVLPGNQDGGWTTTIRRQGAVLRSAPIQEDTTVQKPSARNPVASFDYSESLPDSEYCQVLVSQLPIAHEIRKVWDERFHDPRQPDSKRFAWDPWFVKVGDGKKVDKEGIVLQGEDNDNDNDNDSYSQKPVEGEIAATNVQIQYSLKRATTSTFLQKAEESDDDNTGNDLYGRLVDDLIDLGTSVGLTAISPPWMSLYTEGDTQNFHTDAPHGPLAFVLSLSREGDFFGGETMLLQPKMLDYWRGFDGSKGLECGSIVRYDWNA
jgi:hypothetical protein